MGRDIAGGRRRSTPRSVSRNAWSIGYVRSDTIDGLPLTHFGSGGEYTARAAARVAQLMLQRGCWEGRQLLEPDLVATALGQGSQILWVDPGLELVVVRMGGGLAAAGHSREAAIDQYLVHPLYDALEGTEPWRADRVSSSTPARNRDASPQPADPDAPPVEDGTRRAFDSSRHPVDVETTKRVNEYR